MSVIVLQTSSVYHPKLARQAHRGGIISVWYTRYRYRLMLRNDLLLQPDSVLEDAGISRVAAKVEAQKSFWCA